MSYSRQMKRRIAQSRAIPTAPTANARMSVVIQSRIVRNRFMPGILASVGRPRISLAGIEAGS